MLALLLGFAAAAGPLFAGDAPRRDIVGVDISGEPESLEVPLGVLPAIPSLHTSDAARRAGEGVARFLAENGYPYARVTVSTAREGVGVVLRIDIEPGGRVCFGGTVVVGVGPERAAVFLRDLRFARGQPYSAAAVDGAVRRLASRPYVLSAAAMSPVVVEGASCCVFADSAASGNPCGDSSLAAVVPVSVTERRGAEFEGALGYESGPGRLRGRLSLSLVNMARRGEVVDAQYTGAGVLQKLSFSGALPWAFGLPLEAGATGGLEVEDGGYGYFGGGLWVALEPGGGRWRFGAEAAASETVPPDSAAGGTYRFYGADVFLSLLQPEWERGLTVWELRARTGSGAANRERAYIRSSMELSAGAHVPLFADWALALRAAAGSLFTEEEYLPPAELFRVGGHGSLRGYSEDEFAFRAVFIAQAEALYYFQRRGAVFIFVDGGAGFAGRLEVLRLRSARGMLGYGLGLRFPLGLGAVSLEWGRNTGDGAGLGRVHVGIRTSLR